MWYSCIILENLLLRDTTAGFRVCGTCWVSLPESDFDKFFNQKSKIIKCRRSCRKCRRTHHGQKPLPKRVWKTKNPNYRSNWYHKHKKPSSFTPLSEGDKRVRKKAANAENRCNRLRRTPKWLTKDQKADIALIYAFCPPGYHVDHIIPLQGKTVSGLHVPWNLQYLPAAENIRKGNKCK